MSRLDYNSARYLVSGFRIDLLDAVESEACDGATAEGGIRRDALSCDVSWQSAVGIRSDVDRRYNRVPTLRSNLELDSCPRNLSYRRSHGRARHGFAFSTIPTKISACRNSLGGFQGLRGTRRVILCVFDNPYRCKCWVCVSAEKSDGGEYALLHILLVEASCKAAEESSSSNKMRKGNKGTF